MTIKQIVIITLAASSLTFSGCTREAPQESEVIKGSAEPTPVLTSTTALPEPTEMEAPDAELNAEPKAEPETTRPEVVEPPKELPKPEVTPVAPMDGLTIRRFVTAAEIVEREPIDATSTFAPDEERIYAFVDAGNESDTEKSLMVHFIGPNGKVSGGIELVIPASVPRWRTWAYTRHAKEPGLWRVEIRDVEGNLIGALPFEIEPRL